jgi:sRNA-binding regulator protein Hfq
MAQKNERSTNAAGTALNGADTMQQTALLGDEALAALKGQEVTVVMAYSGDGLSGTLAAFDSEAITLAGTPPNTTRLYRHAIAAIRPRATRG